VQIALAGTAFEVGSRPRGRPAGSGVAPQLVQGAEQLRPRYVSIRDACRYAGVSHSEFYRSWRRRLKVIAIGKRRVAVELASLDALLDELGATG
jgi:hypothetical protein